jgi:DNA-binding CsgD family transcriptional regulator
MAGVTMERRTVVRIPIISRGKAATLHSADSGIIYTANISRQGLCFYSTTSLPLDSEVILELVLTDEEKPPVIEHLHGRVLWKREWDPITVHGIHLSSPLNHLKTPRCLKLIAGSEPSAPTKESTNTLSVSFMGLLTKREHEITRWIAQGASNRQMAQRLSISIKTVETHRANIYSKLKVHNAVQLLRALEKSGAWVVNPDQTSNPPENHKKTVRPVD